MSTPEPPTAGRPRRTALLAPSLAVAVTAAAWLWPGIPGGAKPVLWVYRLALIGWVATDLSAGYVGLTAVTALVALGAVPQERVADVLAADVVWLIFGAFLLGEAMARSGLAGRLTTSLAASGCSPRGMGWRLTGWLIALAFVVPSTTGWAALMLPLLKSLPPGRDGQLRRCLGLLIPTVVLVSTSVTLTGAAAHLLANEMLTVGGHAPLSFTRWLVLAGPFGVVASALTAWLVMWRHLPAGDAKLPTVVERPTARWSRAEWTTVAVVAGVIGLWTTVGLHPLGFTTVMLLGVVVLVAPRVGVLVWKDAVKAVPWDMLILAGSAVWLGKALVGSGASAWVVGRVVAGTGLGAGDGPVVALLLVGVVCVTAHLYLTSHSARVAALVPPLLALAGEVGWNATAVVFVAALGIDYCLTFPISSKAVLIYEFDRQQAGDLFRLSLVLMPAYVLLMVVFYFAWWVPLGLAF